jgi:hypothetical protein
MVGSCRVHLFAQSAFSEAEGARDRTLIQWRPCSLIA